MKLADKLGADAGAFLHVGADHHVMAFVNTGQAHFHHIAFDMEDWGQIRQSFDHLAQYGRVMPWGPVRHGIGGNLAGYVRLPRQTASSSCTPIWSSWMQPMNPASTR
ncbi:hypothetical protein [Amycolatopsis plumensis]|uniref:hypothetical protein n=1 Tax=Amycolatopsis plumensis TaxID=236508 RepID=UPI00361A3BBF